MTITPERLQEMRRRFPDPFAEIARLQSEVVATEDSSLHATPHSKPRFARHVPVGH